MSLPDYLNNPVGVIQSLFTKAGSDVDFSSDWGVYEYFEKALSDPDALTKVPLLTPDCAHLLPDQSLVRYQGMVQDLLNPEYFAGALNVQGSWITTKFHDPNLSTLNDGDDSLSFEHECFQSAVAERRAAYCLPVPGLAPWAAPEQASWVRSQTAQTSVATPRRTPDFGSGSAVGSVPHEANVGGKRSRDEVAGSSSSHEGVVLLTDADAAAAAGEAAANALLGSRLECPEAPEVQSGDAAQSAREFVGAGERSTSSSSSPAPTSDQNSQSAPGTKKKITPGAPGSGETRGPGVAMSERDKCGQGKKKERGMDDVEEEEKLLQEVPGSCLVYLYDMHHHHHLFDDVVKSRKKTAAAVASGSGGDAQAEKRAGSAAGDVSTVNELFPFVAAGGPQSLGGPPCLHEVIDVVGILSHMPSLAQLHREFASGGEGKAGGAAADGDDGGDTSQGLAEMNLESDSEDWGIQFLDEVGIGATRPPVAEDSVDAGQRKRARAYPRKKGGGRGGASCAEATEMDSMDELLDAVLVGQHPPTSKVLRLHAVLVRRHRDGCWTRALPPPPAPGRQPAAAATVAKDEHFSGNVEPSADDARVASPPSPTFVSRTSADCSAEADAGVIGGLMEGFPASAIPLLRQRALDLIRRTLGGDALAAEYLLLQTLGKVTHRSEGRGLGQVPLNLTRCPPSGGSASKCRSYPGGALPVSDFGGAVQAALAALVPLCPGLAFNVEACNSCSWSPVRSLRFERTHPSPLQLPLGSLLLLDETGMAAGQLTELGIASLRATRGLLNTQVLQYDFSYGNRIQHGGEMPVPVDLAPVILSVGRSLLKDEVQISLPLHPTCEIPAIDEVLAWVAEESAALAEVRSYLAAVRQLPYMISEEAGAELERFFVQRRQEVHTDLTPERFASMLSLARLYSLSFGESTLQVERWRDLLKLEHARDARLRVVA